jgi:competence protein ComEA
MRSQAAAALQASEPGGRASSGAQLVIHVVGAVRRPGLYRLPQGSRYDDAVEKAGGATPKADLALINLAAPISDGIQIVVPTRAPAAASGAGASGSGAPSSGGTGSAAAGPVHLNTATLEELDALPGVGPVTAQKILDYRQEHGAFTSVDQLDDISGIGPKRLDSLRDVVAP